VSVKKENSEKSNRNTFVNNNTVVTNTGNNNSKNETIKPIVPNNFNSLINYIQKLNPQEKIVTPEINDQTVSESENTEENNIPSIKDTQENMIQTPVYQIVIPNVITPNGDGFNDFLVIKNLDKFADNTLIIADRKGNMVYNKNSYQNDWDAANVPDGTYYYILSYKDKNNIKGVIKGLLTIIR
jgi:gliding motility-associated-like protein